MWSIHILFYPFEVNNITSLDKEICKKTAETVGEFLKNPESRKNILNLRKIIMHLENYIGYFFGITALITAMLAYQAKKRENLLKISIVTGICWVLYFFLEKSYVSAVVCVISTLKLMIFLIGIPLQILIILMFYYKRVK